MDILEIINSEEFEGRDLSIYLDGESACDLVNELIEEGANFYPDFEELDQDVVILSRNCYENGEEEWFVDALYLENGFQVYNETEVVLIPEDVLEEIDFDQIEGDEIIVLEEDECVHCAIKEQLRIMYDIAREEALEEVYSALDKIN